MILAGDIYDRAVPSGDAVLVFNDFLTALAREGITVYMISGNHDSPERISYGEELLREQGIMIAGVYHNEITVIHTKDAYGDVDILLLPFIKPSAEAAGTSEEAVAKALGKYWEKEAAERSKLPAGQNRQDTKRQSMWAALTMWMPLYLTGWIMWLLVISTDRSRSETDRYIMRVPHFLIPFQKQDRKRRYYWSSLRKRETVR